MLARRSTLLLSLAALTAALACALALFQPTPALAQRTVAPDAARKWFGPYRAAIPAANYDSIVVSPRNGPAGAATAMFVIRTISATGEVDDFAFQVPVGETYTLSFPSGWVSNGDSILYAPEAIWFSAWGITPNGLLRFETVERDPREGIDERERRRDLDEFRRERERNDR